MCCHTSAVLCSWSTYISYDVAYYKNSVYYTIELVAGVRGHDNSILYQHSSVYLSRVCWCLKMYIYVQTSRRLELDWLLGEKVNICENLSIFACCDYNVADRRDVARIGEDRQSH